jgi:hypothetical protein
LNFEIESTSKMNKHSRQIMTQPKYQKGVKMKLRITRRAVTAITIWSLFIAAVQAQSGFQECNGNNNNATSDPVFENDYGGELLAWNPNTPMDETPKEYDMEFLQKKLKSFKNLKTAGIAVTVIGALPTALGLLGAEYMKERPYDSGVDFIKADDESAVFLIIGIPVLITGGILWGIGGKKVDYYEGLIDLKRSKHRLSIRGRYLEYSYDF